MKRAMRVVILGPFFLFGAICFSLLYPLILALDWMFDEQRTEITLRTIWIAMFHLVWEGK